MLLKIDNIHKEIINILESGDLSHLNTVKGKDYLTVSLYLDVQDITSLLTYFNCETKYYFKNKSNDTEFLALGSWEIFSKLADYSSIENKTLRNKELLIVGGQRFQEEQRKDEWLELDECYYFIPQVLIEKEKEKTLFKINLPNSFLTSSDRKKEIIIDIISTLNSSHSKRIDTKELLLSTIETPEHEVWNEIINVSLKHIKEDTYKKIVLCRKRIINYEESLNSEIKFLSINKDLNQSSYKIYLKISNEFAFMSFTPETLFKVSDNMLLIDSLAGTSISSTSEKVSKDLLNNKKELEEHRHVTDYIKENMKELVQNIQVIKSEAILRQKHVQHIHTELQGKLKNNITQSDILKRFHPTPAVGGWPKKVSISFIKELEPFQRGLYASPLGYFSSKKSEFSVAIRSALVTKNQIHLYGGCGIVQDSIPDLEWIETQNKMKNFEILTGDLL